MKQNKKQLHEQFPSMMTKVRTVHQLKTFIKKRFVPERLGRRERLSELIGENNHSKCFRHYKMCTKIALASVVNSRGSLPETMFLNYLTFLLGCENHFATLTPLLLTFY